MTDTTDTTDTQPADQLDPAVIYADVARTLLASWRQQSDQLPDSEEWVAVRRAIEVCAHQLEGLCDLADNQAADR